MCLFKIDEYWSSQPYLWWREDKTLRGEFFIINACNIVDDGGGNSYGIYLCVFYFLHYIKYMIVDVLDEKLGSERYPKIKF